MPAHSGEPALMALQVHFQAWFRCSVMSSLPIRTIQFQRIYGISTFHSVLRARAPCRRSFVIATLCRVHTIQHMVDKEFRQPAESITDLNRSTASIENLRELQKYSEKLAYESTCCRQWAQGIQTHIQDEQEKIHKWIEGMTEDLLRAKRATFAQPHWMPAMTHPLQPAPPVPPPPHASSSSASMVQVKPAPYARNPSTASASTVDPWADAKKKQQR